MIKKCFLYPQEAFLFNALGMTQLSFYPSVEIEIKHYHDEKVMYIDTSNNVNAFALLWSK
jgi:hypothetical protein